MLRALFPGIQAIILNGISQFGSLTTLSVTWWLVTVSDVRRRPRTASPGRSVDSVLPWRHRPGMPKFASRHGFVVQQTWTDNHSLQVTCMLGLVWSWFVRSLPWAGGPPHRPGGLQFITLTRAMQGQELVFHLWKGGSCFSFNSIGLFYSYCLFIFRIFPPISSFNP